MAFTDSPLGMDPPLKPLGTLEAIELSGHPEAHLEPFQTSERHMAALEGLPHGLWENECDAIAALVSDAMPAELIGNVAIAHLATNLNAPDRHSFLLFENAWQQSGSFLGYVGLEKARENHSWQAADIFYYSAHTGWDMGSKVGRMAIENVLAYGQEHWNVSRANMPNASEPYDLRMTAGIRMQFVEGTRCYYTSPFGAMISSFHNYYKSDELLADDIRLSREGVVLNGSYMLSPWLSGDLLASCYDVAKGGLPVEVNLAAPPSLQQAGLLAAYEKAGVKVKVWPGLRRAAIIDRRIAWEAADTLPGIEGAGYMKRLEVERPIPMPLIQAGALV
jgi:hypothetical protein